LPWFPDFTSAVELARRQTRVAGRADPVSQFFMALNSGDTHLLETVWPGEVVIYDPRAGEVRGHKQLRRFVTKNQTWLADRHARIETVASTVVGDRAVVELAAHLPDDGGELTWPVAVVAETPDDMSVTFRTYCSQVPVDGQRHIRSPILNLEPDLLRGVIGRFRAGLAAGDVEATVATFSSDGYFRESIGVHSSHRGTGELRSFFTESFSMGGGITLMPCAVTDDGVRCALEYNVVRWGSHDLPAQAGMGVFERGSDGLLAAVRAYDDIEPPVGPA